MPTTVWTVWAGWTQWLSDWRDVILDRTLDQLLGALVVAFVLSVLMAWVVVRMGRARREALAPVAATLMLGHLLAISVGGVQVHRDLRDLTELHRQAIDHLTQRDLHEHPMWSGYGYGSFGRSNQDAERRNPSGSFAWSESPPDATPSSPTSQP
ncbi:hypothetical protein Isop_3173 [Isosphaera pallida ATCC 43644]|uniref:Uncharacterized protein n=1 Tax=Isosphaera pallida (strain ATCC 43644 / DSM 9630 / IS1B) TaxID=575540 RepID=E8R4E2_ISOPI|nr:hypothetical protein [Isosphaera pallida]ADV63737.1 hypothetical protein Isop_3173 [Isosphaera pallida ATCC 43644]